MDIINSNKLVLFGAGKIGRSFIGQLFSKGGYEVVFIDLYKELIDDLNRKGNYNVIIKSAKDEIMNIRNVRGVYSDDKGKVISEVATAGIVAVSVGVDGLKSIFPILAKGLTERYRIDNNYPLDIIIAENMRNAEEYFRAQLQKYLPKSYPFEKLVGLIETSIGKMVPIMQKKDIQEDILQIFAEPYNTLILNKRGFKNPIPVINGLEPKENMKAWVDRKLFIHNLGHSAAAYLGFLYNPQFIYLYEVLAVRDIQKFVRATMLQSAEILLKKYPDEFTSCDLTDHIDDLLERFQNKALGDTIFRVGYDLTRKLGPQDRLAGAIKELINFNLEYNKILFALVCACHFRAGDEDGNMKKEDIAFVILYEKGIESVLTTICGFDKTSNSGLFIDAKLLDDKIKMSGGCLNTNYLN